MNDAESFFTSKRERNLWLWALIIQISIYATLGLAGKLAQLLREKNLIDSVFVVGFFLAVIATIGSGLKSRIGKYEVWVLLGILAVYGMTIPRFFITPAERTHLFEYGIVAILIYQALLERQRNGELIKAPAIFAILSAALLGWLDEGIQFMLPNRVYDIRDVGFNALAALMAVTSVLLLQKIREKIAEMRAREVDA